MSSEQNRIAPKSSHAKTRSLASCSSLLCNSTSNIVQSRMQTKSSLEQSDVKLSFIPSTVAQLVPSSSPQKPDTDSLLQSDVKLSASSSFPDTVKSDAKLRNYTSYLPTKSIPGIMPSLQWVAKSKASKTNPASIPIRDVSHTPKAALSAGLSAKQIIPSSIVPSDAESKAYKLSQCSNVESNSDRSFHPTNIVSEISGTPTAKVVSGCIQNKPAFEQSSVKSNISVSCVLSKDVSSSSAQRKLDIKSNISTCSLPAETVSFKPHVVPSMQWVVKSSTYDSSLLSKSTTVVSPEPNTASSPICSKKEKNSSNLPKSGPRQKKIKDPELNDSTNSASSKAEPSPNEIKIPKNFGICDTLRYDIPKHIKTMLKNGIVPPVLRMPLTPDTYADYFANLLYAEDIYCQKWSKFILKDVTIKLHSRKNSLLNYPHVVFEIDKARERRPFLLSRDYVHLRPSGQGKNVKAFDGILFRVIYGTTILATFEDDFHSQHESSQKYDVSFSFNRVCLKRAHRAVSAAVNPLLSRILFPSPTSLPPHCDQVSPLNQILNHKSQAPIPYLIEGLLSQKANGDITDTLILIKDIILKIYESRNESRVLFCASKNSTCDALVRSIMKKVPGFDLFRANAAFRDKKEVPDDIMSACLFEEECFTLPPLDELENIRIISTTFVNTFGLYKAGLRAGHFSHIFLMDTSSVIEPEMIVALADLVSEETVVVATGSVKDKPQWIRSDIGRNHGLRKSFFKRLLDSEPYQSGNPPFITRSPARGFIKGNTFICQSFI